MREQRGGGGGASLELGANEAEINPPRGMEGGGGASRLVKKNKKDFFFPLSKKINTQKDIDPFPADAVNPCVCVRADMKQPRTDGTFSGQRTVAPQAMGAGDRPLILPGSLQST